MGSIYPPSNWWTTRATTWATGTSLTSTRLRWQFLVCITFTSYPQPLITPSNHHWLIRQIKQICECEFSFDLVLCESNIWNIKTRTIRVARRRWCKAGYNSDAFDSNNKNNCIWVQNYLSQTFQLLLYSWIQICLKLPFSNKSIISMDWPAVMICMSLNDPWNRYSHLSFINTPTWAW